MHHIDPNPRSRFILTDELRRAILKLAKQPDIHSISCPFNDFDLWEGLLNEQVRRSKATGLPAQEALYLSGPDTGIDGMSNHYSFDETTRWPAIPDPVTGKFAPDFFGGEVHIPYEGATGADLFVLPTWHNTFSSLAIKSKDLSSLVYFKPCNYILTNRDLGEFECAIRTELAGCYLYKSKAPYKDCNPLHEKFRGDQG